MKVTVLMPILNRSDFHANIKRMIDHQTHQPEEVIFVEEKSSLMNHGGHIECNAPTRYVVCKEDHVSYTNKKVRGLNCATRDLIVIMSSDDYYAPDYIQIWVNIFTNRQCNIARFQSHWVYNIVDRRYGLVKDVSGGHSAYLREWALAQYDSNENTLNRIPMPRTDAFLGHFAIIRHTPAGEMREDGFRRNAKMLGRGHTCGTEYTPENDPNGDWLRSYINNNTITDFYLDYGDKAREEYPCAPS